jgi:hypothetical protein
MVPVKRLVDILVDMFWTGLVEKCGFSPRTAVSTYKKISLGLDKKSRL